MRRVADAIFQRSARFAFTVALIAAASLRAAPASHPIDVALIPPAAQRKISYVSDVRGVFASACYECHGPAHQKGGLRLDVKASAMIGGDNGPDIIVGHGEKSPLIQMIAGLDADAVMPAKGKRLSADQIGILRAWIDQGADWPQGVDLAVVISKADHWSFKPVGWSSPPAVHDSKWARNEIDAFILKRLEDGKLSPSAEADRRTLIRRVSFDLIGLPPTPAAVDAFVADPSPDAYEKLVDRLLASPQYGERWGQHWLDVVRFAETNGFEMNQPRPNAWPYRDYVIRAFNDDEPYDQFVQDQLAGDARGMDAATGFLVAGAWDQVKSPDPVLTSQQRADELHDMVSTTGSAFLGLTVGCARCHDHKFDPISQVDYYRLTALLAGVQHGERACPRDQSQELAKQFYDATARLETLESMIDAHSPLAGAGASVSSRRPAVRVDRNVERFTRVRAKFVRLTIDATNDGSEPCLDEMQVWTAGQNSQNVGVASRGAKATASGTLQGYAIHKLEHLNDGLFGNSHSWISGTPGRGWVMIELKEPATIDRVVWGRDREMKLSDRLATGYRVEIAEHEGQWKLVASSADRAPSGSLQPGDSLISAGEEEQVRQLSAEKSALEARIMTLTSPATIYAGKFEQPSASHRLQRGDPMQPQEIVTPGGIEALSPRLDLAADAREQDRRVALGRWIANPANPLTARVMVNRLWHYHFGKGIVATPSDFGHMGSPPSHPELLDWLAREFVQGGWRVKPMQRAILLSATYRQSDASTPAGLSADADSTLLWRYPPRRLEAEQIRDSILFVSGKLDALPGGPGYDVFRPDASYVHIYVPKTEFGPAEWRRMVYQFKPRLQQEPTFGAFDCPDGGQVVPRRMTSITPLQSLNLLNGGFVLQQVSFFAERLKSEAGGDPESQASMGFRLAFGRPPTDAEHAISAQFIRGQSLELFCRALFNANEFVQWP